MKSGHEVLEKTFKDMHKPKDKGRKLEGVGFKIRLCDFIHGILPSEGFKDYVNLYMVYSLRTKADIPGGQNFDCN